MDSGELLGALLLVAFTIIRGAFFVAVIAAIVAVVRAILRAPTYGGNAPAGGLAAGRPDKGT